MKLTERQVYAMNLLQKNKVLYYTASYGQPSQFSFWITGDRKKNVSDSTIRLLRKLGLITMIRDEETRKMTAILTEEGKKINKGGL